MCGGGELTAKTPRLVAVPLILPLPLLLPFLLVSTVFLLRPVSALEEGAGNCSRRSRRPKKKYYAARKRAATTATLPLPLPLPQTSPVSLHSTPRQPTIDCPHTNDIANRKPQTRSRTKWPNLGPRTCPLLCNGEALSLTRWPAKQDKCTHRDSKRQRRRCIKMGKPRPQDSNG